MKPTLPLLSALITTAVGSPAGVTSLVAPEEHAPEGCKTSFDGKFEVTVIPLDEKRTLNTLERRHDCSTDGRLVATLQDSVIKDFLGRTGYISSSFQFQFDDPPQSGSLLTGGFSICGNNSLALGGSTVFYQCACGEISNLYNKYWAPQCSPVHIVALPCEGKQVMARETQGEDRAVPATSMVPTVIVTMLGDGQPQAITTVVPITVCTTGPVPPLSTSEPACKKPQSESTDCEEKEPESTDYKGEEPEETDRKKKKPEPTEAPEPTNCEEEEPQETECEEEESKSNKGPEETGHEKEQPEETSHEEEEGPKETNRPTLSTHKLAPTHHHEPAVIPDFAGEASSQKQFVVGVMACMMGGIVAYMRL